MAGTFSSESVSRMAAQQTRMFNHSQSLRSFAAHPITCAAYDLSVEECLFLALAAFSPANRLSDNFLKIQLQIPIDIGSDG